MYLLFCQLNFQYNLYIHLTVIVIDNPYNRGIYGKNIYRVKDWLEVPNIVLKICENKKSPKTLGSK